MSEPVSANTANMAASGASRLGLALMPAVFVLLWSTGFIGAKLGLPYAEPMTFLILRFAIVSVLLGGLAILMGARWPRQPKEILHISIAGLLLHGVYLGGVFASIDHGVPAGVSSLIVGIQPLLVAAAAGPFLGETVTLRQWIGFLLGLAGVALVVADKLTLGSGTPFGYALSVLALFGMTAGTLYQKKFCGPMDLRSGNAIQFIVTAIAFLPFALLFERMQVEWHPRFMFALGWLCLVLSLGAISLLFLLIRKGEAAKVSSLFYMVPPCTAVVAYFLFDERLSLTALGGMALAVAGVALVNLRR